MSRQGLPMVAVLLAVASPLAVPAWGQTSYPMITRVEPSVVTRGTTVELTIPCGGNGGGDVAGAFALLAQGPGLTGEVLSSDAPKPPPAPGKAKTNAQARGNRRARGVVKARLAVASDAPLGPRELRVATPQGVSSVGLVVVVDDPVVIEGDDKANNDQKAAQELTLPCAVSGIIGKAEDVDWYAIHAQAGQRLTFSVWANRLENKIHDLQAHLDPILLLHDANGRELAADDNHDFADPLLSYEIPRDGTYYLQIRDTTYAGNANWTYVLHATAGPVATSVFPLAVNPGTAAELHALGPNIDPGEAIRFTAPQSSQEGPRLISLSTTKGNTLATPILVTRLPVTTETDDAPAKTRDAHPRITLPAAVCGRLGEVNDVDAYSFKATKGTLYAFEVFARRVGAATDPVLKVVDAKGETKIEADDTPGLGKDPRLEWTAPADGTYALVVSDLHSRGGDRFGYALLAKPAAPDVSLTCDPDKLNVGPGGRVPLFVQVARRGGFDGPVTVDLGTLPTGVLASPLTIPSKMTQGLIVVSAAADAPPASTFLTLKGRAETTAGPIVREATPKQEIYLPGGGRGAYLVETLALAVTDPSDVTLTATPRSIQLAPGGRATIDVTVTRKPGFEQGVNLAVVLQHLGGVLANPLPPGVTVVEGQGKHLLGPTETRGQIVLQAKPDAAPIENVPICVMGHVSINFVVKTAYASEPVAISVGK